MSFSCLREVQNIWLVLFSIFPSVSSPTSTCLDKYQVLLSKIPLVSRHCLHITQVSFFPAENILSNSFLCFLSIKPPAACSKCLRFFHHFFILIFLYIFGREKNWSIISKMFPDKRSNNRKYIPLL